MVHQNGVARLYHDMVSKRRFNVEPNIDFDI